ncbi:sulfur carrier protein ThiS [Deferribacterales bacterium Es71-Z0220]|jgi:sulfur carrier protein|uniref:sulfur carrier protein ThiS n=1 Tax=Deferrivibrio essentukiensis TaxID=2880922 RepID=UPI001F612243|nr:sulfur carrier protein ThiS [Deferrivibrio essentukiensis]MCB4203563.1 sulfur carrier protein ThiS [Deferrivibrio essentukiensis]
MKIILNGKDTELEKNITVTELLQNLKIHSKVVVVEINGNIVEKDNFDNTFIKENDKVEVVRFVGGG